MDSTSETTTVLLCKSRRQLTWEEGGHGVKIWDDHIEDIAYLAERLHDIESLVLIRERTKIRAPLLERLPKLIS
jgi:hypothetical protein